MDDGTRITIEEEAFLRLARAGDADKVNAILVSQPEYVNKVDASRNSALHFAASYGHKALVTVLLKHKADKNMLNYDLNTPLMLCAKCKQPETLEMLLNDGADANFANHKGTTALGHACVMGHLEIAKTLVARGAKVDPTPCEVGSALHWAAGSNHVDTCFWLIYELKVSMEILDAHGGTPLFVAIHSKASDVVQFLLEHGANPNHKVAKDGCSLLHIAAGAGTLEDVKLLLDYGADPLVEDNDKETPLQIAEQVKHKAKIAELTKTRKTAEQRKAESAHFKEQGNKAFANGENNKASKFYSRAIALDNTNHVFFSNRSATYFNTLQYKAAYYDAKRCVDLKPDWPRGYFRLASSLKALKQFDELREVCNAGLKVDKDNAELKKMLDDIKEKS